MPARMNTLILVCALLGTILQAPEQRSRPSPPPEPGGILVCWVGSKVLSISATTSRNSGWAYQNRRMHRQVIFHASIAHLPSSGRAPAPPLLALSELECATCRLQHTRGMQPQPTARGYSTPLLLSPHLARLANRVSCCGCDFVSSAFASAPSVSMHTRDQRAESAHARYELARRDWVGTHRVTSPP